MKIHKFEEAGFGKAPFRVVGVRKNWFKSCPDDPGKPGGTCDYCSTGILFEFIIESSDGHRHIVGSDCVLKTGDAGMKKVVDSHKRELARAKRQAKAQVIWDSRDQIKADALALANDIRTATLPGWGGHTAQDSLRWAVENTHVSTVLKLTKRIKNALDQLPM